MDLIDKALENKVAKDLYEEIQETCQIEFVKVSGDNWGAELKNDIAKVSFTDTDHPAPSLVHELLHIRLQQKGYKRMLSGMFSNSEIMKQENFIYVLDNEFQHHKFFNDYKQFGFSNEDFYADSDSSTENHLRNFLLNGTHDLSSSLVNYFTLIAPGGSMSRNTKRNIRNKYLKLKSGAFKELFLVVEDSMRKWGESSSYDQALFVSRIINKISNCNYSWIGFDDGSLFPENGFFTGARYSLKPRVQGGFEIVPE